MRARRIGGKIVYWLAVLVVSIAILVALILLLESRDSSSVKSGGAGAPVAAAVT